MARGRRGRRLPSRVALDREGGLSRPPEKRARGPRVAADGGGVDVYALGEAALADGGAAVDGFIKTVFESADPRRALEAAGGGG